jgi:hypothetical protein
LHAGCCKIQELNVYYNAVWFSFSFLPFEEPRGLGLEQAEIIDTFERRLQGHPL